MSVDYWNVFRGLLFYCCVVGPATLLAYALFTTPPRFWLPEPFVLPGDMQNQSLLEFFMPLIFTPVFIGVSVMIGVILFLWVRS